MCEETDTEEDDSEEDDSHLNLVDLKTVLRCAVMTGVQTLRMRPCSDFHVELSASTGGQLVPTVRRLVIDTRGGYLDTSPHSISKKVEVSPHISKSHSDK